METMKHFWLYVLKCESDKWYVGITTKRPEARFEQHRGGFAGAAWTKKYKPIKIYDRKDLGDLDEEAAKQYESRVTRVYMKKYGINNVRGGDLTMTNDLVVHLGYLLGKDDRNTIVAILFLLFVIAALLIDKIFN